MIWWIAFALSAIVVFSDRVAWWVTEAIAWIVCNVLSTHRWGSPTPIADRWSTWEENATRVCGRCGKIERFYVPGWGVRRRRRPT